MITPELIKLIYDAASIQRWNDYPRMTELVELDKQAHKFIIAYFLARSEEEEYDSLALIEAGIFEFLRRVIVTDIRPDVFHHILEKKEQQINAWVFDRLEPAVATIEEGAFFTRFKRYFNEEAFYAKERELLAAAHYMATRWEFQIVYQSSRFLSDADDLKEQVERGIDRFKHYKGVVDMGLGGDLAKIVDLNGRLRFQIRWAQTPRVPKTSVLGHVLVVALFSYFYSRKTGAEDARTAANFFTALFHDLPEALTRDIISPVKKSVEGLDEMIIDYEIDLIQTKILPLVPESFREEFAYYLGLYEKEGRQYKDEFLDRQLLNFPQVDGRALKACDHLAAFTEAAISVSHGVKSAELVSGIEGLKNLYRDKEIPGVSFYHLMLEAENAFMKESR